ncbi:hypothetical protein GOBAR_DD16584 [Gossypium barbadense]|nr:hypothetical protein GOBAR_DD16584 [Gossypium barbadense]
MTDTIKIRTETNPQVIAIPEYNYAIGYASIAYYNTQNLPHKQFVNGQKVIATVMALPSPETSGRLLLLLNSIGEVTETSSSKRAKKKSSYNVGSLVPAEVTEIMPLELRLKFGIGFCGRVHITEDLSIKPAMLAEAQKRSFQGLGAAPNSKCCCGDCERTLLGM